MTERSLTQPANVSEYSMDFCVACYLPDAMPLIQGLLAQHAHDARFRLVLTPGPSGSFEIKQNGKVTYSKAKSGRMPTHQDLGIPGSNVLSAAPGDKACC